AAVAALHPELGGARAARHTLPRHPFRRNPGRHHRTSEPSGVAHIRSLVMSRHRALWCLTAFAVANLGCSRADLYPVTQEPANDGDTADNITGTTSTSTADTSTTGSSTTGSSTTGSSTTGSSTTATNTTGTTVDTCPEQALEPGDSNHSVLVDGMMRSYVLHIPPSITVGVPAPLVVDFHGV